MPSDRRNTKKRMWLALWRDAEGYERIVAAADAPFDSREEAVRASEQICEDGFAVFLVPLDIPTAIRTVPRRSTGATQ